MLPPTQAPTPQKTALIKQLAARIRAPAPTRKDAPPAPAPVATVLGHVIVGLLIALTYICMAAVVLLLAYVWFADAHPRAIAEAPIHHLDAAAVLISDAVADYANHTHATLAALSFSW